jgi:hypothetical protein
MPVMVFYKDPSISLEAAQHITQALAKITKEILDAAIEVRVIEPEYTFNSNEVHIEVKFRDFGEYSDEKLATYHQSAMDKIGDSLKKHSIKCSYSFYIIPTPTPRSMWAQAKSE